MAGRAGRRGIDKVGHVIHCNNLFDLPSLPEYRQILNGQPQKLVSKFKISYSLVLSLLGQQETKIPEFVQKSMLQKELDKTIRGLLAEQQSKYLLYDKRKEALQLNRTPENICLEVLKLEENLPLYPAKKQKEVRRQIEAYQYEYKTFKPDLDRWKEIQILEKEIKKGEQTVEYTRGYTDHHILLLCDILREADFIHPIDESTSVNQFTEFGQMATYIREIHPLLGVDIIRFT
jgi:superfamily II RNA helicase